MSRYVFIAIAIILLMLAAINALLNDYFSNTFLIGKLIGILAGTGLFSGVAFSMICIWKTGISETISRLQIVLLATILCTLFFIVAGVNLNYLFSEKQLKTPQYLILDIRPFFKTGGGIIKGENVVPNGYAVYIEKGDGTTEIRCKKMENYQNLIGKTIPLDIRRGMLGYEVFVPTPLAEN
jgi:hypothetical protein